MSKLYDLLYAMIEKLNSSVKTTAQTLTEAEKTQARANIGAMASTFAPTAESVGADPKGTAAAAVSAHNTNTAAHADIRSLISGLADRLNALANSDDTTLDQMKEVVDYIKANRDLIESVTTNKVNVADIVDNLATADAKKPLSAKQGVELLKLINSSGGSGGGSGVNLDSAEVGQLIVVEAVDADGQPIKWRAMDRTHYKEVIGQDAEVISQRYIDFTGSTATLTGLGANIFQDGHTYKVNWNGTEYTCKAYLSDGIVHLGNGSLAGAPVTTDEPFCIVGAGITCMVFKDTETSQSIKFKVDGVAEVVYHKLDGRFLPEGSPYTESGRVEVLEPTSYTPEGGNNDLYVKRMLGLIGGETYIVNWNGAEYTCTANAFSQDGDTVVTIGYMPLGNEEENVNGYPFGVVDASVSGYVMTYVRTYDENPFTVSIYHDAETVHKLDHKYLPDGVPYCVDGVMVELPVEGSWTENDGFTVTAPIGLEIGNTYIVNWDGTEYEVVAQDGTALTGGEMPCVYIGNAANMGANDTGEPFTCVELSAEIAAQVGQYGMIGPVTGEKVSDIPFAIYQQEAEIRKLDNRCLDMDYLKSSLNAVSGTVELDLVSYHASTVTFGTPLSFGLGGTEVIHPITSKIIGGARLLLTFKYNLGSSESTYHGYVTQWWVDEEWGEAKAYFPVAESSDGLYFAFIRLDPETSLVTIRLIKTSATFS